MNINKYSLNRLLLSLALLCILIVGLTNNIDRAANNQLNTSFSSAMKTFILVRGMNAAISVFQGTEVAIEPGGVGIILTPGEILDPLNDLIERFSWVVLAAGTSLGAQILLLEFGSSLIAKIMLLLAGSTLLISFWISFTDHLKWRHRLIRSALLILFLRFLIPVVVLTNEAVYRSFLEPTYAESYKALEVVAEDVDEFQSQEGASLPADTEEGFLSSIGRFYERTTQSMNIAARYRDFSQRVETGADHIIRIIAVYAFQTYIFPLLFLWMAIKLGRIIISASFWVKPTHSIELNEEQGGFR